MKNKKFLKYAFAIGLVKKIVLLGILFFSSDIIAQAAEHLNFKIINGEIVWQKVFSEDLNLNDRELYLEAGGRHLMTDTFWFSALQGATLNVKKQDGKTWLIVRKIYANTRSNSSGLTFFQEKQMASEVYLENGSLNRQFIQTDGQLIQDIIETSLALLASNPEGC